MEWGNLISFTGNVSTITEDITTTKKYLSMAPSPQRVHGSHAVTLKTLLPRETTRQI